MKKQLFSVMLCLGAMGGLSTFPMPLKAAVSQSQTIKVKGQIVDDQGEPLTGATIKIKGGQGGTVTDLDGNFNLDAPANATLIVSYVGYKDREIAVRGRAIIDKIQLTTDDRVLDQVVVVGYGTQKKADLTGSVAVVNAEQLKKVSNSNISTMLEGKVPGVHRLRPMVSLVPTHLCVFVVSVLLVAPLLFMLSMVCQWARRFVTFPLMISSPSRS